MCEFLLLLLLLKNTTKNDINSGVIHMQHMDQTHTHIHTE